MGGGIQVSIGGGERSLQILRSEGGEEKVALDILGHALQEEEE